MPYYSPRERSILHEYPCTRIAYDKVLVLGGRQVVYYQALYRMLFVSRVSVLRQAECYLRPQRTSYGKQQSAFARLLSSLAILEQREGRLDNASLSAVTAAQTLGGSIAGFIAGSGAKSIAAEAAKVKALNKVIMVDNASYDKVSAFTDPWILRSSSPYTPGPSRELRSTTCGEH